MSLQWVPDLNVRRAIRELSESTGDLSRDGGFLLFCWETEVGDLLAFCC